MLVKRSKTITKYVLPVWIGNFQTLWYYDSEFLLYKAYWQLKRINGKVRPSYPVVYE